MLPIRLMQFGMVPAASNFARRVAPHLAGLARQVRDCDPTVLRWSLARILDWKSTPEPNCPVFRIHGDRDFVLTIRRESSVTVVPGGGHVISLTHPSEVNQFIQMALGGIDSSRDT